MGYCALHDWIHRHLPKPSQCQSCNRQHPYIEAACIGEYNRDLSNWRYLCKPCHIRFDSKKRKTLRIVYEQYYRCCLLPWIIIRHRDRCKRDTDITNLEIIWDKKSMECRERIGFKCPSCSSKYIIRSGMSDDNDKIRFICNICKKTSFVSKFVFDCITFRKNNGVDDFQLSQGIISLPERTLMKYGHQEEVKK